MFLSKLPITRKSIFLTNPNSSERYLIIILIIFDLLDEALLRVIEIDKI